MLCEGNHYNRCQLSQFTKKETRLSGNDNFFDHYYLSLRCFDKFQLFTFHLNTPAATLATAISHAVWYYSTVEKQVA